MTYALLHGIRDQLRGRLTLTAVSDEETFGPWGARYLDGAPSRGARRLRAERRARQPLHGPLRREGAALARVHASARRARTAPTRISARARPRSRCSSRPTSRASATSSRASPTTSAASSRRARRRWTSPWGKGAGKIVSKVTVQCRHDLGRAQGQHDREPLPLRGRPAPARRRRRGRTWSPPSRRSSPATRSATFRVANSTAPSWCDPGGEMVGILQRNVEALNGFRPDADHQPRRHRRAPLAAPRTSRPMSTAPSRAAWARTTSMSTSRSSSTSCGRTCFRPTTT